MLRDELDAKRKNDYLKKMNARTLMASIEYKTLNFSFIVSMIIGAISIINSYDLTNTTFNTIFLKIGAVYLSSGMFQYFVLKELRKRVISKSDLSPRMRSVGVLLIPLFLIGNIFATIAGLNLIKKNKTIEYILSTYMIMISISIIAVSSLNLFKVYVADTFIFGVNIQIGLSVFYIFAIFAIGRWADGDKIDKKILPVAALLILSSFGGNVFAFILGTIIISKYRKTDLDVSIEWIDIIRRLFRNNMAIIGLFFISFLLSLSIFSSLTFDYSLAVENNYMAALVSPSLEYPFGTDNFGRCVFTRIVFGARISLLVGIAVTAFPIVVGGLLGAFAAYYSSRVDNIIMRLLDVLYAVPAILLAITIIAAFGAGVFNLIIAISIGAIPAYARIVRATALVIANSEFVEASIACGERDPLIIIKHIIPNSLAPIIVRATMGIGTAVLATSALSYLGLGVESHIPEWGNILKIGSKYLETNSYLAIFPGLAIILIVLSFNFFGDGLRDALDPKLK
jgi:peptide/nickel transport system permease protein